MVEQLSKAVVLTQVMFEAGKDPQQVRFSSIVGERFTSNNCRLAKTNPHLSVSKLTLDITVTTRGVNLTLTVPQYLIYVECPADDLFITLFNVKLTND